MKAKKRLGIVTSLPLGAIPPSTKRTVGKPKRPTRKEPRQDVEPAVEVILGMVETFCRGHLNEEYAMLCRKLTEKLARKRPSPLLR